MIVYLRSMTGIKNFLFINKCKTEDVIFGTEVRLCKLRSSLLSLPQDITEDNKISIFTETCDEEV